MPKDQRLALRLTEAEKSTLRARAGEVAVHRPAEEREVLEGTERMNAVEGLIGQVA